eukprot:3171750-Rhodomonas_salina.3
MTRRKTGQWRKEVRWKEARRMRRERVRGTEEDGEERERDTDPWQREILGQLGTKLLAQRHHLKAARATIQGCDICLLMKISEGAKEKLECKMLVCERQSGWGILQLHEGSQRRMRDRRWRRSYRTSPGGSPNRQQLQTVKRCYTADRSASMTAGI